MRNKRIAIKPMSQAYIIFSSELCPSLASIVLSLVRYIGAGTTQIFISSESFAADSGV